MAVDSEMQHSWQKLRHELRRQIAAAGPLRPRNRGAASIGTPEGHIEIVRCRLDDLEAVMKEHRVSLS